MSEKKKNIVGNVRENEMDASKRRSDRLQEIQNEMNSGLDPETARILAEIEANNKK